jgi:uncharacterized caspase-like protein
MTERRDIELEPVASDTVGSSGRNLVAVIGIDRYQSWRRLTNAVADARGAAALFERLGFEQITAPLLDDSATAKAIQELVADDLRTLLRRDDSLVLFYAGHGSTRQHDLGSRVVETGYVIPADASDRAATWIELDAWLRAVARLPAKHILVILDACHSGIALGPIIKWRGSAGQGALSKLKARRSRRIITSAHDDQMALDSGPVPGHSLFTGCLIEALTHDLGLAGGRVVTGSELGLDLQRRVESYPNSRQTPDFGAFDLDDRGEMVISLAGEQWEDPTHKDFKQSDWSGSVHGRDHEAAPQPLPGGNAAPEPEAGDTLIDQPEAEPTQTSWRLPTSNPTPSPSGRERSALPTQKLLRTRNSFGGRWRRWLILVGAALAFALFAYHMLL